jgi:hypothetical protein
MGALTLSAVKEIKSQKFATGGYVSGQGTGTSDSIPAMLSNGEFVNTARTVNMLPNTVQAIDYMQRTGAPVNIAAAASRDQGGGGSQIVQADVKATLGINGDDLALMVQRKLNVYKSSGGNLDSL